jgi:hypothetical protein
VAGRDPPILAGCTAEDQHRNNGWRGLLAAH